jgi:hypothetical protein
MPHLSIYECMSRDCEKYGTRFRAPDPGEARKATGRTPRCPRCNSVARWVQHTPEAPDNAVKLVGFLADHPRIQCTEAPSHPKVPDRGGRVMSFVKSADGGLWFKDEAGQDVYLPIDCGLVRSETGLTFTAEGFRMEKFGVHFFYRYLDI